ncbi:MAG: hypothetical protein R2764_13210 [Bacteroidales bacterium]
MGNIIYNSEKIKGLEKGFRANFINSLSGFKSISLCGTINSDNIENLAIFNTVIHVGSNPPLLGMLIRPPVVRRDTWKIFDIRDSSP